MYRINNFPPGENQTIILFDLQKKKKSNICEIVAALEQNCTSKRPHFVQHANSMKDSSLRIYIPISVIKQSKSMSSVNW